MALALFKTKEKFSYPMKRSEEKLDKISFTVYKNNPRPKPSREKILIICCFSEFGCETVGCMYCIPRLLRRFPGRYIIVMGWYGREYLYRHLADEFWEISEDYMWLRNHAYAFHHISDNLRRLEQSAAVHGTVIPSSMLGKYVIGNFCRTCGKFWNEWRVGSKECPACRSTFIIPSIFGGVEEYKKSAVRIPAPAPHVMEWAKALVPPNSVGVFARGRRTYGRNMPPEFYVQLIERLERRNLNVIWLGEKQSTLPCPAPHVYDFSRTADAQDLEKTLAIIRCLKFTVQFWTASSRLAAMTGTPFILFESPEQIYCSGYNPGQEGKRLDLTTFGPRKVVVSHYLNTLNDQPRALELLDQAIDELEAGNTEDMMGLVENTEAVELLKTGYYENMR